MPGTRTQADGPGGLLACGGEHGADEGHSPRCRAPIRGRPVREFLLIPLRLRAFRPARGQVRPRSDLLREAPGGVDRRRCASADSRRSTGGSRGGIELPLLPCLDLGVVMEPREDPAKQAQTRPLAPTVGIAAARDEPRCLLRAADQSQDHVAESEREQEPLHQVKVARASETVTRTIGGIGSRLRREERFRKAGSRDDVDRGRSFSRRSRRGGASNAATRLTALAVPAQDGS